MVNFSALFFQSPLLLGMCILLACAIASTSILYFCRPTKGPGYWAICCWLLVVSYGGYFYDSLDGRLAFSWLTDLLLMAGQAFMMLGVFRFLNRPVPFALLPGCLAAQALVEYWRLALNAPQAYADAGYSTIVIAMALVMGSILHRDQSMGEVRSVRVFIYGSLIGFGLAHIVRLIVALPLTSTTLFPHDSIPLLSFFSGLPFLIIALVALTAMSLHRILAQSRVHEANARDNLHRFEQLMRISSAATLALRNGQIEYSSPKLAELFRCDISSLQGLQFSLLFKSHPDLSRDASGQTVHYVGIRADQTEFQAEVLLLQLDEERCLAEIRDVSQQKRLEAQLTQLANVDPLTGVFNRRAFTNRYESLVPTLRSICLVLIDLDHFKTINDQYGHDVGDQVLITFARVSETQARHGDVFARLGGEEFAFLLLDCDLAAARAFVWRLAETYSATHIPSLPPEHSVGFSAGLATHAPGASLETLLKQADDALYRAKSNGRGRIEH